MAWGTPALLNSATGTTAATFQVLTGITAPAGTFVIVPLGFVASISNVSGVTISDSAGGNSWNVHTVLQAGAIGCLGFAWSILTNGLTSGTITMTRTGTGNIKQWAMAAYSLTGENVSSPEDAAVFATATGNTALPSVTGNVASQSNDFVFALDANFPGLLTNYTEDTTDGWTNLLNNLRPNNTTVGLSVGYQANSGTSGIAHAPHLSGGSPWAEMQVAFAPASSTYNVSISESGSAADSDSDVATLPSSVAETGAASDSSSSLAVLTSSVSESGAASDSSATTAVLAATVAEAGAASDSPSNIATLPSAIAETGAAADHVSSSALFPSSVAESGAASDADSGAASFAVSVAEAGSAVDVEFSTALLLALTQESGAASDVISARAAFGGLVLEAGAAQDQSSSASSRKAFDPDYALLAPSRAESFLAPSRTEAMLAPFLTEAFLAE